MNTELNSFVNNPLYLEFFTTDVKMTSATYLDTVVDGHEETQQLIDTVTIRLEAKDLEGGYIDSWIFTVPVPAVYAGTTQFVPYPELTLSQVLMWPQVLVVVVKEISEFQSRIHSRVTAVAPSVNVIYPTANFNL